MSDCADVLTELGFSEESTPTIWAWATGGCPEQQRRLLDALRTWDELTTHRRTPRNGL